jgi:hypothetical protein
LIIAIPYRRHLGERARSLADFVVGWGLGWRYLLSRRFRRHVHAQWASRSTGGAAVDIAALIVAFAALNGLLALAGIWLYREFWAAALRPPEV